MRPGRMTGVEVSASIADTAPRVLYRRRVRRHHDRRLSRDTRGLSTTEYVLILMAVALVGIAAWRMFGSSTASRSGEAASEVGGLESAGGSPRPAAGGGGRAHTADSPRSRLEEATGDATPPGGAEDTFKGAGWMLALAAVLVLGAVAKQLLGRGKGGEGGGDGGGGGGGDAPAG